MPASPSSCGRRSRLTTSTSGTARKNRWRWRAPNHDQANAEFVQARIALQTCQRELAEINKQIEEYRQRAAATAAEREQVIERIRDLERRLAVAKERSGILEARSRELAEEVRVVEEERKRAAA